MNGLTSFCANAGRPLFSNSRPEFSKEICLLRPQSELGRTEFLRQDILGQGRAVALTPSLRRLTCCDRRSPLTLASVQICATDRPTDREIFPFEKNAGAAFRSRTQTISRYSNVFLRPDRTRPDRSQEFRSKKMQVLLSVPKRRRFYVIV